MLIWPGLASGQNHPLGTDVYAGTGTVNWTTVRSDGVSFAWAKAAEGTSTDGYIGEDAKFTANEANAKAAGVLIGGYYFARPSADPNITGSSSADSEAQFYWSVASNYVVAGSGRLVPMLDWEDPYVTNNSGLTQAVLSQWVNEWCNDVSNYARAQGVILSPVIYTGTWYSEAGSYPGLNSTVTNWPVWLSDYPSCTGDACGSPAPQSGYPGATSPWSTWDIWQYGDTNWSGGDSDVFAGTTNQFLQKFLVGATNIPPGGSIYWDPATNKASPGSGGTGGWDGSTSNWWYAGTTDAVWPIDGAHAVLAGTAGTITLNADTSVGALTFNTPGYIISGSDTLTLTSPGTISVPSGAATSIECVLGGVAFNATGGGIVYLNNAANYSDGETVTGPNTTLAVNNNHAAGNDGVTLNLLSGGIYQDADATSGDQFLLPGCAVALGTGGGIFSNPNGNLTMTNRITGAGSLTITGTSYTLTLTDTANSYTGGTVVESGTLKLNAANVLGSTTSALTVSGGALNMNAVSQTVGAVTISGGTISNGTLTGSSYAGQSGTVSSVLAGSGAMTKTTSGTLTLSGANTYSGTTSVNAGTLALASTGSINDTKAISLAAGGTFDVSAISSYTLSSSTTLSASGTSTPATIKGGTTVNLGSRPITLTYDGSDVALTISQGTLSLSGNAFTVNGTALPIGTYTLVQQASGNISASGTFSVSGTAIGSGMAGAISVSGNTVILTITDATTTTLNALSPATYGQVVTFTATVSPTPYGGTVQFYDNGVALGSPVALNSGTASYITSLLAVGSHPITAAFSGVPFYYAASSTASASTQQVSAAALTVTANPQSKTYGTVLVFGSGSTNFFSTGLQNGQTIGSVTLTVSGNGGATNAAVGAYTITPSLATGGTFVPSDYNITYNPGTLTVTLPPNTIPVTVTGISLLANGTVQLSFTGTPGYVYLIDAATNLIPPIAWTTISTNAAGTNGMFSFTDTNADNYSCRYYQTATQ